MAAAGNFSRVSVLPKVSYRSYDAVADYLFVRVFSGLWYYHAYDTKQCFVYNSA